MTQYKMVSIMEIERFSIHDGPGIRTTVFMQGCALRCPWCANPESQVIGSHLMYQEEKCTLCQTCVKNCKAKAIQFLNNKLFFDRNKCLKCHLCEKNCLNNAIKFIGCEKTTYEIMDIIKKDLIYYQESNGGVTFSGGDCLIQIDALEELICMCKKEGFHVAIETEGDVPFENFKRVLDDTDLFLFDVKHYNPDWITNITKGNGKRIQDNFKMVSNIYPEKIIARVPIIPGFNFDEDTIRNIFKYIQSNCIVKVDLLPYHTLGIDKYKQLGRNYSIKEKMISKKDLQKYIEFGKEYNLEVHV